MNLGFIYMFLVIFFKCQCKCPPISINKLCISINTKESSKQTNEFSTRTAFQPTGFSASKALLPDKLALQCKKTLVTNVLKLELTVRISISVHFPANSNQQGASCQRCQVECIS